MRGSFLLPFAILSGSLLAGCGARDALQNPPRKCGWSGSDGVADEVRSVQGPFAVLDDGSVAAPVSRAIQVGGEWTGWGRGFVATICR